MDKNKTKISEVIRQYNANCDRINEIADTCEKEQRSRNEAEEREYSTLCRQNEILQMRMHSAPNVKSTPNCSLVEAFRREIKLAEEAGSKKPVTIMATRSIQTTAAIEGTGLIPVNEGEILKPLRAGLIWDKLGMEIKTGQVGTLRWAKHGKAQAKFVAEAASLTGTAIDWDKIEASPKRIGTYTEVTRQEIFQSEGVVEDAIREELPMSIAEEINAHIFATDKTGLMVYGPLVDAGEDGACQLKQLSTQLPTRKDLLQAKAMIASAGINPSTCCFVMTEAMKAELEDIPVDRGSGRFLCENDRIFGYPVYTTDAIGEKNIAFGDWSYQAAGFFGSFNFIVDPYSLALNDSTRFVLNTDFATATLRPEAFVLIKMAVNV